MKIIITASEAIEKGIWERISQIKGYDVYAVSEGMDPETEIELTQDQAIDLGIIN